MIQIDMLALLILSVGLLSHHHMPVSHALPVNEPTPSLPSDRQEETQEELLAKFFAQPSSQKIADEEELDLILLPQQKEHMIHSPSGKHRQKRKIVEKQAKRWPMPIFYKFDPSCTDFQRHTIRGALSHWQEHTCIHFFEVNDNARLGTHHIIFTNYGTRCGSFIGMVELSERKPQTINLPNKCLEKFGTAVHEVGHALGLWHEHQRPDRDGHVRVVDDNLVKWASGNFDRARDQYVDQLSLPYDYNSIMHYAPTAGSRNGSPTLTTLDSRYQMNIGQRVELSFLDAKVVNMAYCRAYCSVPLPYPCQHGGYQDPNDCGRCRCPDGLSGRFCDEVAPSTNDCGGTISLLSETTVTVTSPGYMEGQYYDNRVNCNWHIKAPKDHVLQLIFINDFSIFCRSNVCYHWVEVRNKRNFQHPGPRYCCSKRPNDIIESEGEEMLITFRTNWTANSVVSRRGFSAVIHASRKAEFDYFDDSRKLNIVQGDDNLDVPTATEGNEESKSSSTPTAAKTTTTTTTTTTEATTTESTTPDAVITTGFSWSNWSTCNSQCRCGSCGTQSRHRLCDGARCTDTLALEQHRRCSRQCTEADVVLRFAGQVYQAPCPVCCVGYQPRGSICVPSPVHR